MVGAFADGDWGSIRGQHHARRRRRCDGKLRSSWAVGGRIGWLVVPRLLTYFSGGYTEATFDRQNFFSLFVPIGAPIPGAPYLASGPTMAGSSAPATNTR